MKMKDFVVNLKTNIIADYDTVTKALEFIDYDKGETLVGWYYPESKTLAWAKGNIKGKYTDDRIKEIKSIIKRFIKLLQF